MSSPYIDNENRLADVIAAIQGMGTYRYYKQSFEDWADRISGDKTQSIRWKNIFIDHPEFFRLNSSRETASLVARRQHAKLFDASNYKLISKSAFLKLNESEKQKITRSPLSQDEIATLITTAIELHARAIEQRRESRYWYDLLLALLVGVLATVGAYFGSGAGS